MYSLIRSLIGLNEARMLIQVSVVVRTTRTSDSPSIPTLYWIPNVGIQSRRSTNWNGRDAGAFGSNPMIRNSDAPHAIRLVASASDRASRGGATATTSAPTSGVNVTTEMSGRSARFIASGARSSGGQDEERAGHDDQPERDPQRIVLDASGLDAAQARARADRRRCDVVDRVIDDPPIEPPEEG